MAAPVIKPRVLCLDGGGIRGLSEILILKELMLQVRIHNDLDYTPEPYQCFDFICGTSTGGLVAVLLGRLGKTLNECEELFRKFGSDIFETSSFPKTPSLILKGSTHTGESLADVIRTQAGDGLMFDTDAPASSHVPVAVVAISKTTSDDYLFRTYGVRANAEACPIVDACRATSAASTFFPSIVINGVEYVDGAFRKNNPSGAALTELESSEWIAPMQDSVNGVACFVSVGTGRPNIKRKNSGSISSLVPGASEMEGTAKLCMSIATDCHKVHLEVKNRFLKAGAGDAYYRFDVDRGLESITLNESSEEALQHISAVTKGYLKEHSVGIERCAKLIVPISSM